MRLAKSMVPFMFLYILNIPGSAMKHVSFGFISFPFAPLVHVLRSTALVRMVTTTSASC
jgi:hypothetical protein